MRAAEINKAIREGKIVTAQVKGEDVRILKSRTDMMSRIAVQVELKGSFYNVEPTSIKVSDANS